MITSARDLPTAESESRPVTIEIRAASSRELSAFGDWAEREGWQPGVDDISAFHRSDPEGFLVAVEEDRVVGMISLAHYSGDFAFLGFYIVSPDLRGRGLGHRLFNAALARGGESPIGLDGVPDQISSYQDNGFQLSNWTPRWSGSADSILAQLDDGASTSPALVHSVDSMSSRIDELIAFDTEHVPAERGVFVRAWLDPDSPRRGFMATHEGVVVGYSVVRPTRPDGSRIGPLFAEDESTARELLRACAVQALDWPGSMSIDVPEPNAAATVLMESLGMTVSFTCARMYRGTMPQLPFERIYGSTTYELG